MLKVLLTRIQVPPMNKPTIQDIFLHFYPKYLEKYTPSPGQAGVAHCIINCKTGSYGVNVSICENCGHPQIHYNSCRNRCCPMCQALPKEKWMDKRREDVLVQRPLNNCHIYLSIFPIAQFKNPQRSSLRLRFLNCTLRKIYCVHMVLI